jgi:hypothetical protein
VPALTAILPVKVLAPVSVKVLVPFLAKAEVDGFVLCYPTGELVVVVEPWAGFEIAEGG